jgi:DNA-binding transcriptional MerR regulator
VNERSYLSIGEVLHLLHDEFPDVTISKIRFLESQGLIDPERTPSGYRKFYDPDIERLKFILREQKDSYLPLKIIKNRLEAGETTGPVVRPFSGDDAADDDEHAERTNSAPARPAHELAADVPDDAPTEADVDAYGGPGRATEVRPAGGASNLTFEELATASGLTPAQLRDVERFGLLVGRPVGRTTYYDDEAVLIARLAAGFLRFGIEPRHLRMYRNAAEREAGVFEQVILPLVKQRNPSARSQALGTLEELSRLGADLRGAMVRQALRGYTESL